MAGNPPLRVTAQATPWRLLVVSLSGAFDIRELPQISASTLAMHDSVTNIGFAGVPVWGDWPFWIAMWRRTGTYECA